MPGKSFMEQRFTTSVARAFFHATTAGACARHAKGSHRYAQTVLLHSIIVESQYNNQNLPTRRRFVAYCSIAERFTMFDSWETGRGDHACTI
jgi:hypothetical protein